MSKTVIIRVPINQTRVRQTRAPDRVKELVSAFASEHCDDTCKLFKETWNQWIHSGEIDSLLIQMSNREEIENKLFFSARYYHRKKTIKMTTEPIQIQIDNAAATTTRAYNKTDRPILQLIDDHLADLPNDPNGYLLKPSLAFDNFVALHGYSEYKKTYKNRFYMKEKHIVAAGR